MFLFLSSPCPGKKRTSWQWLPMYLQGVQANHPTRRGSTRLLINGDNKLYKVPSVHLQCLGLIWCMHDRWVGCLHQRASVSGLYRNWEPIRKTVWWSSVLTDLEGKEKASPKYYSIIKVGGSSSMITHYARLAYHLPGERARCCPGGRVCKTRWK